MKVLRLGVWLLICVVIAVLTRRRPVVAVGVILAVWMAVPGVAGHLLTGSTTSSYSFQPATWLTFIVFIVQLLADPRRLGRELGRHFLPYVLLLAVVVLAYEMARFGPYKNGSVLVIDQILAPVLMFALGCAGVLDRPRDMAWLRTWIVGLAVIESLFAIVQRVVGRVLVYSASFDSEYFFHSAGWTRWMGTTDHPLALSMLACVAIPLVAGLRPTWIQIPLVVLLGAAVLITESRTGVALGLLGIMYVIFRSPIRFEGRLIGILVLIGAGIYSEASGLTSGLQDRLVNDTGSAAARGFAYQYFFAHWTDYFWSGGGITSAYSVALSAGLQTSFESAIVMYAVGIGVVATVIYFGIQLALVAFAAIRAPLRGVLPAGLMVLFIPQTYSSLAGDTVAGPLLWVTLILCGAAAARVPKTRRFRRPSIAAPVPPDGPLVLSGADAAAPTVDPRPESVPSGV